MVWPHRRRRAADATETVRADTDAVFSVVDANFFASTTGGHTIVDF